MVCNGIVTQGIFQFEGFAMRVISKFNDYYDIGMSYGQDQSLIFHRQENKIIMPDNSWGKEPALFQKDCTNLRNIWELSYRRIIVGFCGEAYLCYYLELTLPHHPFKVSTYAFNEEAVRRFLELWLNEKTYLQFLEPTPKNSWRTRLRLDQVQKVFSLFNPNKFFNYFIDKKIPIFVAQRHLSGRGVVVCENSNLSDVEFYKVIDPYTAYQEISMFIGGVLGVGEPDIIEVSDECKRDGKGFNDQSFKTRAGTKPNRKGKRKK